MMRHRADGNPAAEPAVVFEALADPTRRALLQALSQSGPATLAQLSARLPVTRQAVTKHLALLREAGLVTPHGEVRGRRYELTPAPLAEAVGWMMDVGAGWDERLARLKSLVESRHR
jgi:DNA-binding transcriptional ArsR family regulator